jgi:hypothetical protein
MEFQLLGQDEELPQPGTVAPASSPVSRPSFNRVRQVGTEIATLHLSHYFETILRERSEYQQRHRQFRANLQQENLSKKEKRTRESEFTRHEATIKRFKRPRSAPNSSRG